MLLLPIWLVGSGELGRFVWLNTTPGAYERNGLVKGRDFVQFYVAGTLAREGGWDALYDVRELERAVARVVPAASGDIPAPLYGPQVALMFAPLSKLPYLDSRWWWCAFSLLLYLSAAAVVIHTTAPLRGHLVLAYVTLLCNPALALLLSTGQTGGMGAIAWAGAVVAFSKGRMVLFGACLGILTFKPSLLVGALPVLVLLGNWRALMGLVASSVTQVAASLPLTGVDPWLRYFSAVRNMSAHYFLTDTVPHQKHSLLGFFQLLVDSSVATTALTAVAASGLLMLWWRHRRSANARWCLPMLAVSTVLLSPHLYVYDLVVLVPGLLVAADALSRRCATSRERIVAWTGYALLFAPFSGALAGQSRLQLSTVAMMLFVVAVSNQWTDEPKQRERDSTYRGTSITVADTSKSTPPAHLNSRRSRRGRRPLVQARANP